MVLVCIVVPKGVHNIEDIETNKFQYQIVVPNPDVRGRQEILELYLQDKPIADDVDVKAIARGTPGFNGAGELLFIYLR